MAIYTLMLGEARPSRTPDGILFDITERSIEVDTLPIPNH